MNAAHLHLILNHIPVLGTAFGLGLLTFAIWRKSEELKKTALGVFVLAALLTLPAYLTGEPAEGIVKTLPGISKPIIEQHEQAAGIAFTSVALLGAGALVGLFLSRRDRILPRWFGSTMVAASLTVAILMAWTANLGGQVHHTELRPNSIPPAVSSEKNHE
jgi:hypothetical protein